MKTLVSQHVELPMVTGDVGIEVELESTTDQYPRDVDGWHVHNDGSLRYYGVEYVSDPLPEKNVSKALATLADALKKGTWVDNNPRTSVHIHMNMLKYTPINVWNLCVLYWILEELLYDFSGDERKGNVFCLRLCDAEEILSACVRDASSKSYCFNKFGGDHIRYGGLNLQAMMKFGTLEFRSLRGTLDVEGLVQQWINILIQMRNASLTYKDPAQLLEDFVSNPLEDMMNRIFDKTTIDLLCTTPDWKEKVVGNYTYLLPFVYSQDWETWMIKKDALIKEGKEKRVGLTIRAMQEAQELKARGLGVVPEPIDFEPDFDPEPIEEDL